MTTITFEVPGKPQGKARARTVFNPKMKRSISYTPQETVNYENLIKILFLQKRPVGFSMMQMPVSVIITAVYRKAKANKMILPMLKPDADNICKCVLDSLNGIAYSDDKQVVDVRVIKKWSEGNDEKLIVTVQPFVA